LIIVVILAFTLNGYVEHETYDVSAFVFDNLSKILLKVLFLSCAGIFIVINIENSSNINFFIWFLFLRNFTEILRNLLYISI
jgi:ABC-type transport system involved in multi-copper enzyme maturation permease subunit